jgi:large subunit ribosomal protein L4
METNFFSERYNEALVHQVVTAYLSAGRQGTKAQKTRAEIRGGGIKPFKQKGTGRARAGTIRSPLWRTGGKVFAAKPRDFAQKVNRKMHRKAMVCILSELLRQGRMQILDALVLSAPKTKELVAKLNEMNFKRVLIILGEENKNVEMAARNIPNVAVIYASQIDPVSLLAYENIVTTQDAVKLIEEKLS